MASILNTTKLNFHVERLIEEATDRLFIVSPYLKIHARLMNLLAEKMGADLSLTIIYGKTELEPGLRERLEQWDGLHLYFCPKLHAKIYANNDAVIVSSLNLYEFSQINNYEVGVLMSRDTDQELFTGAMAEVEMIRKGSTCQKGGAKKASPPVLPYAKLSVTQLAKLLKVRTAEVFSFLQTEGLILRANDQWTLTEKGKNYGGEIIVSKRFGEYIAWPRDIIEPTRQ